MKNILAAAIAAIIAASAKAEAPSLFDYPGLAQCSKSQLAIMEAADAVLAIQWTVMDQGRNDTGKDDRIQEIAAEIGSAMASLDRAAQLHARHCADMVSD